MAVVEADGNKAESAPAMVKGSDPKAESLVFAFRSSWMFSRPGYFDKPPQEGIWHISNGEGIWPWKSPAPPRTTKLPWPPGA